jgi:hypothetical protein
MFTTDGDLSLGDQEAAIQSYEAAACELLGFMPLMDDPNKNGVSFRELVAGSALAAPRLTTEQKPAPATPICVATIYVAGVLTKVWAYR